jgi:hypothetical protein
MTTMTDTRWDSAQGSITTEEFSGRPHRVFRLSVHSPAHGWRAQAVSVAVDRLEAHPHLYRTTLDLLVRELAIWDPQ